MFWNSTRSPKADASQMINQMPFPSSDVNAFKAIKFFRQEAESSNKGVAYSGNSSILKFRTNAAGTIEWARSILAIADMWPEHAASVSAANTALQEFNTVRSHLHFPSRRDGLGRRRPDRGGRSAGAVHPLVRTSTTRGQR